MHTLLPNNFPSIDCNHTTISTHALDRTDASQICQDQTHATYWTTLVRTTYNHTHAVIYRHFDSLHFGMQLQPRQKYTLPD